MKKPSEWIKARSEKHLKEFMDSMEAKLPGSVEQLTQDLVIAAGVSAYMQAVVDYLDLQGLVPACLTDDS